MRGRAGGARVGIRVVGAQALVVLAAVVFWGGCRQNPPRRPREVRVAEAVAEKLAAWRERRGTECHREALAQAQALADSLIMDYAFAKRLELARPSRPIRPEEPPLLRPDDSLSMAPFRGDTLIRASELPRRRPPMRRDTAADAAPLDTTVVDSAGTSISVDGRGRASGEAPAPLSRDTVGGPPDG